MAPALPTESVNTPVPTAVAAFDANSGIVHDIGACQYTPITTNGTTTVKASAGIYYGCEIVSLGTATAAIITALDGTNTIANSTSSLGGSVVGSPGPAGLGIRCLTSIIVVTSGTAGTTNALWD